MSHYDSPKTITVRLCLELPVGTRWQIYHRLQELKIECSCSGDGSLRIKVNQFEDLVLLQSTLKQFTASRQELIDWLDKCWNL
ncbi:MAG: hypothetical protein QNJ49_18165 [Mastigocoleus sp. MO_167.B18]|uniref:Asr1405/Asl0597 family protein n=1 Tax=Mastigocoleus sp. MO_188.B34 TaxID=3036635 RepID=UPI002625863D|nr:Asr1405/Asl0597 family protein [Mastigocoleus sp. MO_188.B34]MDJ0697266.1 hypothetical protein [Mastigocoleus sp. MO_188.B34]MDJ0775327.1 hypothetical protein [Mastigocoleus sp. MO_167.B18]